MLRKVASIAKEKKQQSIQTLDPVYRTSSKEVESTHTPELVIALCGPVGSPLHKVAERLQEKLENHFNYEKCEIIRLSKVIEEHTVEVGSTSRYRRIDQLITEGNKLRKKHGNSILADFAINKISTERELHKKSSKSKRYGPRRVCHIIDSIKNQEELDTLRLVYRDMLYFLGVFSPITVREQNLINEGMERNEVYKLIDRDSGEEFGYGQSVKDTFPQADFFLRIDSSTDTHLNNKLDRFLNIIMGVEIATPSYSETAMYLAASAALNSACLSRQVGASLTDENGEVISVGWNDVPKYGGNLYQYNPHLDNSSEVDERCTNIDGGKCFNETEKNRITKAIVDKLNTANLIEKDKYSKVSNIIKNSEIGNLIEFSRAIHAEMHAIIQGSILAGNRIKNGKLFCTTYPCHYCARHIIAAGIKEVYYIEPYPKSLAIRLHTDSITELESDKTKVRILPFDGISPTRYMKFFKMKPDSRKQKNNKEKKKVVNPNSAYPINNVTLESLSALEGLVLKGLIDKKLIDNKHITEGG